MGCHQDSPLTWIIEKSKGGKEVYLSLENGDGAAKKTSSLYIDLQAIKIDWTAERGGWEIGCCLDQARIKEIFPWGYSLFKWASTWARILLSSWWCGKLEEEYWRLEVLDKEAWQIEQSRSEKIVQDALPNQLSASLPLLQLFRSFIEKGKEGERDKERFWKWCKVPLCPQEPEEDNWGEASSFEVWDKDRLEG